MKRILGLIGLIGLVLTSCKNDAIDINVVQTPEPTKTLSLNISTSSGYEVWGIESYQTSWLNNNQPYTIGVKTYLYDGSGNIVDSASNYTKTFTQIEQNFSGLERGSYTAVIIETLVNTDYHNTSDYWYIDGANQLSTLTLKLDTIKNPLHTVGWSGVVATASKTFSITSDMAETLNPSPVGSLLNTYYYDFDKSNYIEVNFFTKNLPVGMMLNPSVRQSEKYIYQEYLESHTWDWRDYVYSQSGLSEQTYSHTVYLIESGNIQWCFGAMTSDNYGHFHAYPNDNTATTFEDGNKYYAGFCYKGGKDSSSDCEAYIGATYSGLISWYDSVDKSQQDQTLLYKEPYLEWGGSVSAVQSFMSSYSPGNSSPEKRGDYYLLWYNGKNKEEEIDYYFTSSSKGLYFVNVFFDSNVGEDEIMSAITNYGYNLAQYDDSDGTYYYLSSDNKTVAAFWKNSEGYWIIQYYENPSGGGSDSSTLFEEPCLDWGASVATVKKYAEDNGYVYDHDYTSSTSDDYWIYYKPKHKENRSAYIFDPDQLKSAYVYFDTTTTSISQLEGIVKDSGATYRFTSDSGSMFYYSADKKTTIVIGTIESVGENYIGYMNNTSSARTRASMEDFVKKCEAQHQKASVSRKGLVKPKFTLKRMTRNMGLPPKAKMKSCSRKLDILMDATRLKK